MVTNPQASIVSEPTCNISIQQEEQEHNPDLMRKLPTNITVDSFVFLDLYTEALTDSKENPASHLTQRGEQPHILAINSTTFTQTPLPRAVIPYKCLTANLDQGRIDKIKENPEAYLAIVPFGAGSKLFRTQPILPTHISLFIQALAIGENSIDVSKPV
ncbi:hypothetical protein C0992_002036 [Termitomyces sp. T32_za158]|nr:hypothetical protein C0992_002036 [Termitomyces sp. T32_za158]